MKNHDRAIGTEMSRYLLGRRTASPDPSDLEQIIPAVTAIVAYAWANAPRAADLRAGSGWFEELNDLNLGDALDIPVDAVGSLHDATDVSLHEILDLADAVHQRLTPVHHIRRSVSHTPAALVRAAIDEVFELLEQGQSARLAARAVALAESGASVQFVQLLKPSAPGYGYVPAIEYRVQRSHALRRFRDSRREWDSRLLSVRRYRLAADDRDQVALFYKDGTASLLNIARLEIEWEHCLDAATSAPPPDLCQEQLMLSRRRARSIGSGEAAMRKVAGLQWADRRGRYGSVVELSRVVRDCSELRAIAVTAAEQGVHMVAQY